MLDIIWISLLFSERIYVDAFLKKVYTIYIFFSFISSLETELASPQNTEYIILAICLSYSVFIQLCMKFPVSLID